MTDKDLEEARAILGKLVQDGRPMAYFLSEEIARIRAEASEKAAREERERIAAYAMQQMVTAGFLDNSEHYSAFRAKLVTSLPAILTPESCPKNPGPDINADDSECIKCAESDEQGRPASCVCAQCREEREWAMADDFAAIARVLRLSHGFCDYRTGA